jgi:hydrogenase nickel incorporation protein HypA/HybF
MRPAMHEFSLAQGLIKQLQQLAEQHGAGKIITVRVAVGRLSGIVIDSFSFGFEVLAREYRLTENAVLEITEIEPVYRCLDCEALFPPVGPDSGCPHCTSKKVVPAGGDDLILTQVEME